MIQIRVLFGAQYVLDLVNDSYAALSENATDAQRNAQHEMRKKDQKALFYIHQCVDVDMFEKIVDSTTAKAAWDTLVRCYGGDASVKKVRLQSLCKQYENISMKTNEKMQSSLEAQELHLTERTSEREVEQALKASFVKKDQKQSWSEAKKRHDYWSNKKRKSEEANITRSYDDEHVILMASDFDSASLED
ncbi:uncharacterized protein LOC127080519 [Lathyrus oleraceus]|uniref:uncharacterized protein LOC127080519 n=1 Tax=Pisum sativum TaxID=3888 RepID=UPI0021D3B362|nr:uncharacterized protein LOC127080519 [Pisum sativum]